MVVLVRHANAEGVVHADISGGVNLAHIGGGGMPWGERADAVREAPGA